LVADNALAVAWKTRRAWRLRCWRGGGIGRGGVGAGREKGGDEEEGLASTVRKREQRQG
jgi:hypothetical protein